MWRTATVLTALIFSSALAGSCKNIGGRSAAGWFEPSKFFTGTWYELGTYNSIFAKDVFGNITFYSYPPYDGATFTYRFQTSSTENEIVGRLSATAKDRGIYRLNVLIDLDDYYLDYWIVSTNFEGWAVVYACTTHGFRSIISGWVLGREPDYDCLSQDEKRSIYGAMGIVEEWEDVSFHFKGYDSEEEYD